MAITYNPEEYIAALGDATPLINDGMGGMQGVDILNQYANQGSGSYNIPNGGFVRPVGTTDPTYSSGYDYARSIAGGMPMSQVIAPGVSYSPEQPMGYTQADLNIAAGITPPPPPPPPVYQEPDDPSFFGTGIGGVRIHQDRKNIPFRNIFGNNPDVTEYQAPTEQEPPVQLPPQELNIEQVLQDMADSGTDFTNLFGLPQAPDLSQFVTVDDLPTGGNFSVDQLNLPDFNEFALRKDLPIYKEPDLSDYARITDLPTFNPDELRQDILMSLPEQKMQDLSGFMTQDDINKAIAGIDMPTYQAPDLSAYDTRLANLEQNLTALQQPTGGRFSINQPQVRGLF